jgi:hypothetical protein
LIIAAKANINQPPYTEASLMPPPVNSIINLGITGIIIPKPITSINKVIKIKLNAGFLAVINSIDKRSNIIRKEKNRM